MLPKVRDALKIAKSGKALDERRYLLAKHYEDLGNSSVHSAAFAALYSILFRCESCPAFPTRGTSRAACMYALAGRVAAHIDLPDYGEYLAANLCVGDVMKFAGLAEWVQDD